jgi:hypothetical protein
MVFGLALGLGLPFGFTFAFLREMLDRRVRLPQDIATYMNLPLIAVVPIPRGLRKHHRTRLPLASPSTPPAHLSDLQTARQAMRR